VTLLAISLDAPADSRAFAADLGIWFPLLSDADGAVLRAYAGMSSDAAALPGVTVIGRDGRIAFRHIASEMDDRVGAAELLAILDRTLGTAGPRAEPPGFAALDRAQLRVELGGGAVRTRGDTHGTATAALGALVPLGVGAGIARHILIGPWLSFEPREAPLAAGAALAVRAPFAGNLAALELAVTAGYVPWDATGWAGSARAGLWFAYTPRWAFSFDLAVAVDRLGDADDRVALFATFGIARLIRTR
jgi:AhpC/TSA family protein